MGLLKWTTYEYYTSSPQEFYYACKGYFDEREEQILLHRNAAFLICQSFGAKHSDLNKAWPVDDKQKEDSRVVIDSEMKDTIKRIHGISI